MSQTPVNPAPKHPTVDNTSEDYVLLSEAAVRYLGAKASIPEGVLLPLAGTVSVPVPPGFSSLWKEVFLEVSWRHPKEFYLSWRYLHTTGGTNGILIGGGAWNPKDNSWWVEFSGSWTSVA